jgi:hypothetical protein
MNRIIIGAALAAAISFGAASGAGAQSAVDRVLEREGAEASRQDSRDRWDDRRNNDRQDWERRDQRDQRSRYDSRLGAVRLDEYLRGLSLDRVQRVRVERAWDSRGSREQRLRWVRAQLSRTQQRRFDANVAQIERRYGR